MRKIITKVNKNATLCENISVENRPSWAGVLADLRAYIERLEVLVPIVERKIARGEPWPGTQSENQTSESCHSV
jgi:hypothetical protein